MMQPVMKDSFVINGFYMSMREKYTKASAKIHYYVVEWDGDQLPWKDFRGKVLGATDPESAEAGSVRRLIFEKWEELGLSSKPDVGDNGVHASASPFEALAERINWLGASVEEDSFGKAMLKNIPKETILAWTKDPQIELEGSSQSCFDSFEDINSPDCLNIAQKIAGVEETTLDSTNCAFVFIKPHAASSEKAAALVAEVFKAQNINVLSEGDIEGKEIEAQQLIDNHYYAIANKASLSKPADLSPTEKAQEDFKAKFGITWPDALEKGKVRNAVDGCAFFGVDGDVMDKMWAFAKQNGQLVKFGGGFYAGRIAMQVQEKVEVPDFDSLTPMGPLSTKFYADLKNAMQTIPEQQRDQWKLQLVMQDQMMRTNPNFALIVAIKKRNFDMVKILVEEYQGSPDATCEDGNSCLHWTSWFELPDMLDYFVAKGASVSVSNPKQQQPLHWASMAGSIYCIRKLVAAGADFHVPDCDGYTAVHCCAQHGKTAALDFLRLSGANMDIRDTKNRTALHWAAYKNAAITTQFCIKQGLAIGLQDTQGRSALHWACSQDNVSIVQMLVEELEIQGNMDPLSTKDDGGVTPLELAKQRESRKVVGYLNSYTHRRASKLQRFKDRASCITNSKGQRNTGELAAGKKIMTYYYLMLVYSCLVQVFLFLPEENLPRSEVSEAMQYWVCAAFGLCAVMWWWVHKSNPGYIAQSGEGDDPSTAAALTKSTAAVAAAIKAGSNSNSNDVAVELLQEDALQQQQNSSLTYAKCLEQGKLDLICVTCRITRPLRSKHCRHCQRCVAKFDHHCPWVDNCVGEANHWKFTLFLIVMTASMVSYFVVAMHFWAQPQNHTAVGIVVPIPCVVNAFLMSVYVGLLAHQQLGNCFKAMTTNEMINAHRYDYLRDDHGKFFNPWDFGWFKNALIFWQCQKMPAVQIREGAGMGGNAAGMGGHAHGRHGHAHGKQKGS